MLETELQTAVQTIKDSLTARPEKTITGSVLGELIRIICPQLNLREVFSSGKVSVSRFIDEYFSGFLYRAGKQGLDIVYSLGEPSITTTQAIDYQFWSSFARTNSKTAIYLTGDPATMALTNGAPLPTDALLIKSVSPEELQQFQRRFIENHQEEVDSGKIPQLEVPYPNWSIALKSINFPLFKKWSEFRISQLLELFSQRLLELNIAEEQRNLLVDAMRRAQTRTPAREILVKTQPTTRVDLSSQPSIIANDEPDTDARFRAAVLLAVSNLSIAELRELKLPAGEMLDAYLNTSNN